MDRIIPDDIIDSTLKVNTTVAFEYNKLKYSLHVTFYSFDDIAYRVIIEHRGEGSIMTYTENDNTWQYYFSPYISQRYFKYVMSEYAKTKSEVNHKAEIISLINKIKQRNLSCKEVSYEETE